MPFDLDRFRADYPDATSHLREVEGFSRADLDDLDAAVQAAYARNDSHELDCWAHWIADHARQHRRARREAAEAKWVSVIPLMTPAEIEQLQRAREQAPIDTPYRGICPK